MKRFAVAFSGLALLASAAGAQGTAPRPLELGIDAGVTIGVGDNSYTTLDIPAQAFRVGFPISPRTSLEPKLMIHLVSDDGTSTSYRAELGLLYHLGSSRYPGAYQRAGAYVRPFLGLVGYSVDNDGDSYDESNGLLGAGIGFKMPLLSRLSSRFEANFAHRFGDGDANEIGLLAGLSFFTR